MIPDEFVQAFRELNQPIYKYIVLRVCHKEVAQDLTQEVFVKAWAKRETYNSQKATIKTWLFVIARNLLIDYYRDKRRKNVTLDEELLESIVSHSAAQFDEVMYGYVLDQIGKMSNEERDLILLRYVEGLSVREVSVIVQKSYNATKVAIHRAFKNLKKKINA